MAVEVGEAARKADDEGNYGDAYALYLQALDCFMSLKDRLDARQSSIMRDVSHQFITRAEELKDILDKQPKGKKSKTSKKPSPTKVTVSKPTKSTSAPSALTGAPSRPSMIRTSTSASALPHSAGGYDAKKGKEKDPEQEKYRQLIYNEIVDTSPAVAWDDIAGAAFAKQTLMETIILPQIRPELFTGLREPARGILLFGPPGNGKTMLAKAVASQCESTFFNISASAIMTKWVGDGEKIMKALFAVARERAPSVIFFDEIDSMLSARNTGENEASRRVKTEFLVQFDGVTSGDTRILVMGATNRPMELDDAVLRRLVKRIYLPPPDAETRRTLLEGLLKREGRHKLAARDIQWVVAHTESYSGSDLTSLCKEAAYGPLRELAPGAIRTVRADKLRPLDIRDFETAVRVIRPSSRPELLRELENWNEQYGTYG
eukprot:GILK01008995.1.p1 GENE.GILK01008995.1~~GILK01008995.1.p1  ORF type:complete len:498 (-),score=72.46 GILK01008995.1:294-1592(-)